MSREDRIVKATARLADEVSKLLTAAVKQREEMVAGIVRAVSVPVECSAACGYAATAYNSPRSGECPECGDGWVVRSAPSPSDLPSDPEEDDYHRALHNEMLRLDQNFNFTGREGGRRRALLRAAEKNIRSRRMGTLDGEPLMDSEKPLGTRIDGKVLPHRKKRPRPIL